MKKLLGLMVLLLWAPFALAMAPYIMGDKVDGGGTTPGVMAAVEKKLQAQGFNVIGHHYPRGLLQYGVVIVTDNGLLNAVRNMGGSTIVGAPIRVGVKFDGTVSYANPEYWGRAFFRKQYGQAESAIKSVEERLKKALGNVKGFGGDVPTENLANYRYMAGMERFDSDQNELKSYGSFEAAVKAVQDNLAKRVKETSKVYEIVMPDKKIAVFGVALNDPKTGEGWWVKKVGPDNIAAMPYEVYVVGNKVNALYGRYRIAISWPSLGMGTFMGIGDAPDEVLETLTGVAGGVYEKASAF